VSRQNTVTVPKGLSRYSTELNRFSCS
jgi:hypothetical protein